MILRRSNAEPLAGYVDADWANDTTERKSTTGFTLQVFGNTVIWCSRKQGLVAISTTEAEYIAAATGVTEAIWTTKVLEDLCIDPMKPITLYEDDVRMYIFFTESRRSKHIDMKYHCLRDHVGKKNIKLSYFIFHQRTKLLIVLQRA